MSFKGLQSEDAFEGSTNKALTFLAERGFSREFRQEQKSSVQQLFDLLAVRVGQGFWVYGIQGLLKSGIRYISAEIWVFGISCFLNFRYKVYLPFMSL